MAESRFYDPKPNPSAVVTAGKARFTVLTDHIIRMEWGNTVDAPTFGVLNRNLPLPKFTTSKNQSGWTVIKTQALTVRVSVRNILLCSYYEVHVDHVVLIY